MKYNTIEDGFYYNLKHAAKEFVRDFDNKEDAIIAITEGDHADQFATYLMDRVFQYVDLQDVIREVLEDDK